MLFRSFVRACIPRIGIIVCACFFLAQTVAAFVTCDADLITVALVGLVACLVGAYAIDAA